MTAPGGRGAGPTRGPPEHGGILFTRLLLLLLPPSPCSLPRRPRGPPSPAPPGGDGNLRLRCGDGERRQGPRCPDGERWRRSGGGRGEAERGGEAAAHAAAGSGGGGRPWPGPGPDVPKREARDADEPPSFRRWEEDEDEGPERPLLERYMMAPAARGSRGSSGPAPLRRARSRRLRAPEPGGGGGNPRGGRGLPGDARTKWRPPAPGDFGQGGGGRCLQ